MTDQQTRAWPRITVPPGVAERLGRRGQATVTQAAQEALERYLELLEIGRAALRDRGFPADQLGALAAVSSATVWSAHDLGPVSPDGNSIAAAVADEDPEVVGQYTDRAGLLRRLRDLSAVEVAALIDALERYWRAVGTGMRVDAGGLLD